MLIDDERGIVRVGLEIEVAAWSDEESFHPTVAKLLASDFMWDDGGGWDEYHQYHCNCQAGCREIRSGNVIYPPLVSVTYDASLPDDGAEFITSPTIIEDEGLNELKPIWDIVVERAVWDNSRVARGGGVASPSVHVHVSATKPGYEGRGLRRGDNVLEDYIHALTLFAPELLAVASSAGVKRGLAFRQPLRMPLDTPHHGFVNVKKAQPGELVYIEWRMFEAVYDDWEYIEAVAYLSATLTRALLDESVFTSLMAYGYDSPYDFQAVRSAVELGESVDAVLKHVDPKRLEVLREICLDQIDDDEYGGRLLVRLFDRTKESIR